VGTFWAHFSDASTCKQIQPIGHTLKLIGVQVPVPVRQVISPEFVKRIDTELTMAVSGQCAPGRTAFRDAFPRPDVPLDRPAADTRHNWTLMTSVFPANLNRTFVPIREICRTIADQRKLIYQYK
jgi:hypothetical protein